MSALEIVLEKGARFVLTELFVSEAFAEVTVKQAARSLCHITAVQLSSANASYTVDLEGRVPKACWAERSSPPGRSIASSGCGRTTTCPTAAALLYKKGVAGRYGRRGSSAGWSMWRPDAQRTDAQQQNRNILLSETARITTQPQLEIYADDVKCSHGATVGQMDSEAILYMRQRGLSEAQARRVQIEGFVGDVVRRCGIEPLCEAAMERWLPNWKNHNDVRR